MSIFDDIVRDIDDEMPRFNDFAINGFNTKGINDTPEVLKMIFEQSSLILDGLITLDSYKKLSPEETVAYEFSTHRRHTIIPTTHSSVALYRYNIRCHSRPTQDKPKGYSEIIPVYLYVMRMRDGLIWKSGRPIAIMKCLLEKTFARVLDSDKDGISANVIRVNMTFGRKTVHTIESL